MDLATVSSPPVVLYNFNILCMCYLGIVEAIDSQTTIFVFLLISLADRKMSTYSWMEEMRVMLETTPSRYDLRLNTNDMGYEVEMHFFLFKHALTKLRIFS